MWFWKRLRHEISSIAPDLYLHCLVWQFNCLDATGWTYNKSEQRHMWLTLLCESSEHSNPILDNQFWLAHHKPALGNLAEWEGDQAFLPGQMKQELTDLSGSQDSAVQLFHRKIQPRDGQGYNQSDISSGTVVDNSIRTRVLDDPTDTTNIRATQLAWLKIVFTGSVRAALWQDGVEFL